MNKTSRHDAWSAGDSYELYRGRWSRSIASRFLDWLNAPPEQDWLEVGCGSGALSSEILARCQPRSVVGLDQSEDFVRTAENKVVDDRARFFVGDAQNIDLPDESMDYVVSALVLNFIPDKNRALTEMRRVAKPGGTIAFYVWDYPGGGVEFMHTFWHVAVALDPTASELAEDKRFPDCTEGRLSDLASRNGLTNVESSAIEAPAVFKSFDDFWHPFTLGAGPAPGYCISLNDDDRENLRATLERQVIALPDGTIPMKIRAWAIKASTPK